MTDPIRPGYLIPQFPGQTHIFFWRELQALEALDVHPFLISTRPPPAGLIAHEWSDEATKRTEYLAKADPLAAAGGLLRLPLGDWRRAMRDEPARLARDMLLSLPAARRLTYHARKNGITHVHVHSCGRAALIAAMAYRMGGPGYSLTLHGPLEDYGPGQRYKWRHARFATIITRKLLAEAQEILGDDLPQRVAIQPMGVDTDRLRRDRAWQPPAPDGPIRVMSCGRLNPVKGHQDLLQAVWQLRQDGHDIRLTIAGEDDDGGKGYRKTLETRIAELGLTQAVTLLGAVSEAEVRQHLLSSHIFALASWHEPLGVALMEAMSCELPTIGTAAGGVAELITDGQDGLLIPPRSPAPLAAAILRLAYNPDLARKLGQAGRARIVKHFGASIGAETLLRMIREQQ